MGVGVSKAGQSFEAGKEAAEQAIKDMQSKGGNEPVFGLVFCSGGKYGKNDKTIEEFVNGVQSVFGKYKELKWIGCTTAGEITPDGVKYGSTVAMVIGTKYIKFGVGVADGLAEHAFNAGKDAAEQALKDLKIDKYVDAYITFLATKTKPPSELIKQRQFVVLALGAGFTMKKSGWEDDMIDGIKHIVGDYTPIVGGSAGDDGRLVQTYQFANGKVYKDAVVLAIIFSNVKLGFGIAHGFEATDKMAVVTKAKDNIVYQLNSRNAADVYAEMIGVSKDELIKGAGFLGLGEKVPALISFMSRFIKREDMVKKLNILRFMSENPFGIPDVQGNYWTKVPKMIIDKKYIEFYSKIRQNIPLVLLKINEEMTLSATARSIEESVQQLRIEPAVTIIFECGGRAVYLGEKTKECIEKAKKRVSNIVGFYTYAEYGLSKNMPSGTHYYTCVSFSIGDELITE